MTTILRNFRYALRMLMRSPGFTAVAVLTLALGIGANVAVFSVVNALILRPLPVERPSELAFLENARYGPSQSFPNYRDLRDRNQTFAGLVGYRMAPMELETDRGAERIWGYLATGNYFDVLGVKPALGRFFHQNDDVHPGDSPYAVLSYGAWQARFGGDPAIVGKTIPINRLPYTVFGVAPPDFHGTELFYWPEVWVPMMMEPRIESQAWLDERSTSNTFLLGRLKPNVSPAQAEVNLNTVAVELARQFPSENDGLHFKLTKPGLIGDLIGGPARTFWLGVLVLASLVLLAACTNLASMFTARAADRQRELAVRLAIGAGRGRVVRQVLTETLVLSLAGGGAGYLLASFLSSALSRWRAPMDFPVQWNVTVDWRVFLFALAGSIVAAGLFGSAPAWHASGTDPNATLRGLSTTWGRSRLAFRDVLVVIQVALCFVLVSASFLSLRGLQQAFKLNLGFEPQHVSTAAFELNLAGYSEERGRAFQRQALEAIKKLPGVESAAYSNSVPLSIDQSRTSLYPADKTDLRPSDRIGVVYYQVSPEFFAALGIKLLAGREFTWHDDSKSPPVAIINLALAKRAFHTENAVGKRFPSYSGSLVEVVGIAEDGKYESLTESQQPVVFWPILQRYNSTTTLEVKSSLPAAQMVSEVRSAMAKLDPEMPLYGAGGLEQMLGFAFLPTRAAAVALSAFGLLAIMLAATGIHGLVAYAVSRRTHEIGIRMAIGARPIQILRVILGKTAVLLFFGSLVGFVLALAAGRVITSIVYESQPRDPLVMFSVWCAIALLGLFASWSPARRATRVDPLIALHYE
ncbi:MAG: ABC transporter substrate-binding protein [Acidobacteria bacterium]|nr:MAG: ABC transporter substrate-binding protein [Acidobacteriota bacterium]